MIFVNGCCASREVILLQTAILYCRHETRKADAGFVILEQVEYPLMSGSNTICVATALIETGMVEVTEPETVLTLEAPAGLVTVTAEVTNGKVKGVTFENVPAFAVHLDEVIDVPELGKVTVDVAWGGMFYVVADAERLGIELLPDRAGEITRAGEMIKAAAREQLPSVHPENPNVSGVTICVMTGLLQWRAPLQRMLWLFPLSAGLGATNNLDRRS